MNPRDAAAEAGRTALIALVVTLAIQAFIAMSAAATAVLAPEISRDLGVSAKLVGVFVGIVYVGSMSMSLASGFLLDRFGAIRLSQVCVLLCVAGAAAIAFTPGSAAIVLVACAIVIGLGYGAVTPASSQVLARTAPPSRMALTFSIKQTGVPAGAAIAGALLPPIALVAGWRGAMLVLAALGIVVAIASEPTRRRLDAGQPLARRPFSLVALFAPLRVVLRSRHLSELALTGFVYAATLTCLMSFLVVYLTETLGFALVPAGLALTAANIGGIIGRVCWGAVADQWLAPRRLLAVLGFAAAACAYATAAFDATWPRIALLAVCVLFGSTAIGWNGVQLSQVARYAPEGQAGAITGATGFITFFGVVLGPPIFALLASLTGSYRIGFAVFGSASLICGAVLVLRRPREA